MPLFPTQRSALGATSGPAKPPPACRRRGSRGYTLVEMLTTIAVLVIVMGLMVSLARRVRAQSAESVTKGLLRSLDALMVNYVDRYHQLPAVYPFVPEDLKPGQVPEESVLQANALRNNRELLQVLRAQLKPSNQAFADQPNSSYDDATVRDAWRMPIVFMPTFHPAIGMAPGNRFFFLSAGPDCHFLTRDDNLYSYEGAAGKEFEGEK